MTIMHEAGDFWVCRNPRDYTVYRNGSTHAVADSTYERTPDGLSLAIARCDYLAERYKRRTGNGPCSSCGSMDCSVQGRGELTCNKCGATLAVYD